MKQYHIYVFSQDRCSPCDRLKDHVKTLTTDEQAELDFVPLKAASGNRTALAEEFSVELTPTLVVTYEQLECSIDLDDEEYCHRFEVPVEIIIGANNIIEHLDATLDAYTYAHSD